MAGLGRLLSSAMRGLVDGLEAGIEEGVRMEVEKIREDERREREVKVERERVETERSRIEEEERRERERVEADRGRVAQEQTMEKQKTGEGRPKEEERIRAERQKEGDEMTAFWTTPGLRPLAEPPILDWDWLFRVLIPSDLRYKALFPDDPEKRCRAKDLEGELAMLTEYSHCAGMARDDPETDSRRRELYRNLLDDIGEDHKEVNREWEDILAMPTRLSRFEFMYLDNDGGTTGLEEWIKKGADVFYDWGEDEIREKYSDLVPQDFVETRLATFDFMFLYFEARTDRIRGEMEKGHDVLAGWPQEVQDKYGHFRQYLRQPPPPATPLFPTSPNTSSASSSVYSVQPENLQTVDDLSLQLRAAIPTDERRASI